MLDRIGNDDGKLSTDPSGGARDVAALWSAEDDRLAESLLTALASMAARSKRRQADLGAALRASGLRGERDRIEAALDRLGRDGMIENIVPLSDGGMLLSVTTQGIERQMPSVSWYAPQQA